MPTICGVQSVGAPTYFGVRIWRYRCEIRFDATWNHWDIQIRGNGDHHHFFKGTQDIAVRAAEGCITALLEHDRDAMKNLRTALRWQKSVAEQMLKKAETNDA